VGEVKEEIAREQGTHASRQELYRVAVREDGGAVREDDAEPQLLGDDNQVLEEGAIVAMAVKEPPFLWRTFPEEYVELSEGGAVATQTKSLSEDTPELSLVTSGIEVTEGRHYWEVELLELAWVGERVSVNIYVGVTRPNLKSVGAHNIGGNTDAWFIANHGSLYGNGMEQDYSAGLYDQGDRVGVLLDLNNGSLLFFKNGVQHGPGYPAGSVTGPVVAAASMWDSDQAFRIHTAAFPAGHAQ
jgi:hypothetical protein